MARDIIPPKTTHIKGDGDEDCHKLIIQIHGRLSHIAGTHLQLQTTFEQLPKQQRESLQALQKESDLAYRDFQSLSELLFKLGKL